MQTPVSLQRVMEFEARVNPADHVLSAWKVPMWSIVRAYIAAALFDAISGTNFQKKGGARGRPNLKYFYQTWARRNGASHSRRCVPIVYITTGGASIFDQTESHYFNWISDHCAQAMDVSSQVVEVSRGWVHTWPRAHPDVSSQHDWIALRAWLAGRLTPLSDSEAQAIDNYINLLQGAFGDTLPSAHFSHLRRTLQISARSSRAWFSGYQRFFELRKPKLLQINAASYGGLWAYVIRWARAAGIPVAEFQHGYVGRDHYAYNYAPEIARSDYAAGLPDFFLTFGQYWADALRTPSKTVVIGSPRMSEHVFASDGSNVEPYVLLASTGVGAQFYLTVVQNLLRSLPARHTIRFRPHPGERHAAAATYAELFKDPRVMLDHDPDVYRSINGAALVVGDITTLMFEAVGLGTPVRIIDCEIAKQRMPASIFRFLTYEEIPELLARREVPQNDEVARHYIWAPNWRRNYREFVSQFL